MLWLSYILLIFGLTINADEWFGLHSQFRCHCENDCTSEGFCIDNGKCAQGWFGFKCQYRNQVVNSFIYPDQYGTLLTDGDNFTCINNASVTSLEVRITTIPYTWLRLKLSDQYALDIKIKFRWNGDDVPCKNERIFAIDKTTLDVHCDINVPIISVEISGTSVQSLCELYISGGRNVALKGSTSQPSNFSSSYSTFAVDGILDNSFPYISHTDDGDQNPSWALLLSHPFLVNQYFIVNRGDCCQERLQHFTLYSYNPDLLNLFTYTDNELSALENYSILDVNNSLISRLNISQTLYSGNLSPYVSLAEVEVYGECPPGTWGLDCIQCDSKCINTCNVDGGWCSLKCMGYSNPPLCNIPCEPTFYGADCAQKCSNLCMNEECNHITGDCTKCTPELIEETCENSKYFGAGFGAGFGVACILGITIIGILHILRDHCLEKIFKRKSKENNTYDLSDNNRRNVHSYLGVNNTQPYMVDRDYYQNQDDIVTEVKTESIYE